MAASAVALPHTLILFKDDRVDLCASQHRKHAQHQYSPCAFLPSLHIFWHVFFFCPSPSPPPLDSAATSSGKRAAPFPRRPQPTEKSRLAPPHSTRSIRAAPATGRSTRMQGKDQSRFCASATVAMDLNREGEGGGHDDRYGAQRAAGEGDEGTLVRHVAL